MRLIDADAFLKPREEWLKKERKKNRNEEYRRGYLEGAKVLLFELKSEMFAPTVDAEPVRHGRWECVTSEKDGVYGSCSICGYEAATTFHCPNCGAKMDEVTK